MITMLKKGLQLADRISIFRSAIIEWTIIARFVATLISFDYCNFEIAFHPGRYAFSHYRPRSSVDDFPILCLES